MSKILARKEFTRWRGDKTRTSIRRNKVAMFVFDTCSLTTDSKVKVEVEFYEPVALWYSKRKRKEKTTHEIKEYFAGGFKRDTVYYIAGRMRVNAFLVPLEFYRYVKEIRVVQVREDYSTQWRNIAESMLEYEINEDHAQKILEHLDGERDNFFAYLTKDHKTRKMSFKQFTIDSGHTLESMKKRAKDSEKNFFWEGEATSCYAVPVYKKRDKSVKMIYNESNDSYNFYASSEYVGTMNGDYYFMYSPTMAVFVETD